MMTDDPDRLFEIYSTLDEACVHDGAPSAQAYAQVAHFIDDVRWANPASEFLPLAEDILITMHRLQTGPGSLLDKAEAVRSRHSLKAMCDEWIRACPLYPAVPAPLLRTLATAG